MHSFGGTVMTAVDAATGKITGVMDATAFAPEIRESATDASSLAPASSLRGSLNTVPLMAGVVDQYFVQSRYHTQFCADIGGTAVAMRAVTQRPITPAARGAHLRTATLWRSAPRPFVFRSEDRHIPVKAHRIMADWEGCERTIEVAGASQVVGISHPDDVIALVRDRADRAA